MLTFLFWNLNGNPLEKVIANLVSLHHVDILILAECKIPVRTMLETLNPVGKEAEFHFPFSITEKIFIYTRFSSDFLNAIDEDKRTTIRKLSLPARTEILLVATHLPSKLHRSENSQDSTSQELGRTIREVEGRTGLNKTLLVGDLNQNPFESGIVDARGLHAVATRAVATKNSRKVDGKEYPFFYNPMWRYFGDENDRPSGTYYYGGSEPKTYFWNIYDQVLLRPNLVPLFEQQELRILTGDGKQEFLKKGVPDKAISDHLPILFKLNI